MCPHLLHCFAQQSRLLMLNAGKPILKQNGDAIVGRWVPMAAPRDSNRRQQLGGGWRVEGASTVPCGAAIPSALGFPITLLTQQHSPLGGPIFWVLGRWALICLWSPSHGAALHPHLRGFETHVFDPNLQEWMKLSVNPKENQGRQREAAQCFPTVSVCYTSVTIVVMSHIPYTIIYHRFFFILPHFLNSNNSVLKGSCITSETLKPCA